MNQTIQPLTDDQKITVLAQLQTLVNKLWIQSEQRRLIDDIQRGVGMLLQAIQLDMQRADAERAKQEVTPKPTNGALEESLAN